MLTLSDTPNHKDDQAETLSDDLKIKGSQYRFTLTKLIDSVNCGEIFDTS
ncbi:hypothetical protein N474_13420 [Pseudoalteromonas luteoviolacea CPMOR-2]|uniref:Uncharacterized protein n=1 Tax=Pseudoalteromonas luteoviolacea DSM 6061 TaxID=1365250 RepID=A0A166UZ84_9GAMM|nr:hypothetical protein [Pseudoalteromonas luteoviolacea]KZN31539.1 hypothetical protein N475_23650 [Pseudoalteromonas luteoviolacea DSM 6061]KZN55894.1 hypothetical protein N474_13420 [Pseudoalteromonas luteoviolacea CPMOR-2]MBE0388202.1 hypothetical protein [Pseudoalteromonas luteoviolacea DSM 6061]